MNIQIFWNKTCKSFAEQRDSHHEIQQSHSWLKIQETQNQKLKTVSRSQHCAIHNKQGMGITKCLSAGE